MDSITTNNFQFVVNAKLHFDDKYANEEYKKTLYSRVHF